MESVTVSTSPCELNMMTGLISNQTSCREEQEDPQLKTTNTKTL